MESTKTAAVWAVDDELVEEAFDCPACGEARMDYLPWDDMDWVHCAACGTTYDPATGAIQTPSA